MRTFINQNNNDTKGHKLVTDVHGPANVGDRKVVYCSQCAYMVFGLVTSIKGDGTIMICRDSQPPNPCLNNSNDLVQDKSKDLVNV